ncbi:class I lanthipeptide [Chitinophaga varians]|uniref:class I lanthipeptide n=1 Tax=Chitinophaga varians TaxID=2202339 RepID=UPI00165EC0AA|nr:class I lanthipeptide [Chitinophaga varians]MBC9909524.1 class I lanthipeptide [Chitinophaga varians]
MKKKNTNIGRKLSFNKETIAALNSHQQQMVVGGATFNTCFATCTSGMETCATIQRPGGPCELCPPIQ